MSRMRQSPQRHLGHSVRGQAEIFGGKNYIEANLVSLSCLHIVTLFTSHCMFCSLSCIEPGLEAMGASHFTRPDDTCDLAI